VFENIEQPTSNIEHPMGKRHKYRAQAVHGILPFMRLPISIKCLCLLGFLLLKDFLKKMRFGEPARLQIGRGVV
jgi:hypothetical protein